MRLNCENTPGLKHLNAIPDLEERTERTGAVRSLKELFSDSINALVILDKFAVLQSLKHNTFYNEYLVVRRIKNVGEHSAKAQPVTEVSNPTLPRAS